MSYFGLIKQNNVTDIKTLIEHSLNDGFWDSLWENKWRVYECKYCGWIFFLI
jgi:hypothetical protein